MAYGQSTIRRTAANRRTRTIRLRPAFTLVELMAALLILAVAVALTHGIGTSVVDTSRARETRVIQDVIRRAMAAYAQSNSNFPQAQGEPHSSAVLLEHLRRCEPCGPVLQQLPRLATFEDDRGRVHLVDAFGSPMLYYHDTGELTGRPPTLISRGADHDDLSDDIVTDLN
jgi:prepilin-type N-terminal cleavage/methylation domain-containing protein